MQMLIKKTEEFSENYRTNLNKKKTKIMPCDKLEEKFPDININRVWIKLYSVYLSTLSTDTGTLVAN